jgi:hypothetical protein
MAGQLFSNGYTGISFALSGLQASFNNYECLPIAACPRILPSRSAWQVSAAAL